MFPMHRIQMAPASEVLHLTKPDAPTKKETRKTIQQISKLIGFKLLISNSLLLLFEQTPSFWLNKFIEQLNKFK